MAAVLACGGGAVLSHRNAAELLRLERAVNDADKLGLVDPETLRKKLDLHVGEPGVKTLRTLSTGTPSSSPTPTWRFSFGRLLARRLFLVPPRNIGCSDTKSTSGSPTCVWSWRPTASDITEPLDVLRRFRRSRRSG